jgi:hypothetical protein
MLSLEDVDFRGAAAFVVNWTGVVFSWTCTGAKEEKKHQV